MTGRKAALWSIPAIGAALAALSIARTVCVDPDAIRAELSEELAKLEAMPAEDPVRKDRRIHELKDNEAYPVYARSLWLKLEKLHDSVHAAALLDEEARKKVPPFLARSGDDPGLALDECRALLDSYGGTRFGPALRERQQQLTTAAEKQTPSPELTLVAIHRERLKGRFALALKMADDAMRDFARNDAAVLKFKEAREEILKSSKNKADRLLAQAAVDRDPAPLQQALPDFSGLPDAGRLEAMIRQLRTR